MSAGHIILCVRLTSTPKYGIIYIGGEGFQPGFFRENHMSYMALYRKFRPDVFDEVKGQDAIVATLRNQVRTGRTGHAYLFCGTRGTGKTTLAKIFAKAINCEHPVDGNPCGECDSCKAIAEGRSMNVIEIDAASNNGVDNIREIREEVSYRPTQGHYKVYIIDEVHMLSTSAFNALLKTLEEPPEYVVFILATTEARSILPTITSRCQRFDFKRMTSQVMVDRLSELMKREGAEGEEKALEYIARKADGSMRDAISLLDQCLTYYPGEMLTYDHVLEMIGTVDTEVFEDLFKAVISCDTSRALVILENAMMEGREAPQIALDFGWYLRNLLLCKNIDDPAGMVDFSSTVIEGIREWIGGVSEERIIAAINDIAETQARMRLTAQKRVLLEMTIIRLCTPPGTAAVHSEAAPVPERSAAAKDQTHPTPKEQIPVSQFAPKVGPEPGQETDTKPAPKDPVAQPAAEPAVSAPKAPPVHAPEAQQVPKKPAGQESVPDGPARRAMKMLPEIRQAAGPMMRSYLREGRFRVGVAANGNMMVFKTTNKMYADWLNAGEHKKELEELISKVVGDKVGVAVKWIAPKEPDLYDPERGLQQIKMDIIKEED